MGPRIMRVPYCVSLGLPSKRYPNFAPRRFLACRLMGLIGAPAGQGTGDARGGRRGVCHALVRVSDPRWCATWVPGSVALPEDLDEHSYFPCKASVAVRFAHAQSCPAPPLLGTLTSASVILAGEGIHVVPALVPPSSSASARVGGSRGLNSDFSKTAFSCPSSIFKPSALVVVCKCTRVIARLGAEPRLNREMLSQ